jgi:DNA-binding CsgD family transcriptional regulator
VVQELTLQNDDLPIVRMIKLGSGIWRAFADDTLDMVVSLTAASNESMASAGPSASALGETYYFNILAGLQVEGPPFEVRLRDDQLARSETSLRSGDLSSAAALADQALRAYVADDALSGALVALEQVARVLVAVGESRDAARILGACDAFREERQLFRFPFVDRAIETSKLAIRADLGDEAGRALTEGRQLSLEAAIEFALRQRSSHAKESIGWASLTPTESRVAELVANGRTNREVGAELLMSPETVKTHLSRVFTKLGITNRRALSFEAAKH